MVPGPRRELPRHRARRATSTACSRTAAPRCGRALGYRPDELEGTNERELIHPVDLRIRDGLIARLVADERRAAARRDAAAHQERRVALVRDDRHELPRQPVVHGIVTNARDVTERKAAEVELIELSLHDALTGLPNRSLLMDRLAIALARTARANDVLAVLFCDLDEFKVVNDSVGHEGGDRVLSRSRDRLRARARVPPTPSPVPVATSSSSCAKDSRASTTPTTIAEHIRDVVEQPIVFDDFEAAVSVSIGIVTVPGHEASTPTR